MKKEAVRETVLLFPKLIHYSTSCGYIELYHTVLLLLLLWAKTFCHVIQSVTTREGEKAVHWHLCGTHYSTVVVVVLLLLLCE